MAQVLTDQVRCEGCGQMCKWDAAFIPRGLGPCCRHPQVIDALGMAHKGVPPSSAELRVTNE